MGEKERIEADADRCSLPGHDQDVARAILNQSRQRGGISDVQVAHLLAIGHRAGAQAALQPVRLLADLLDDDMRALGYADGHPAAAAIRTVLGDVP